MNRERDPGPPPAPDLIREDIARTRRELSETVEALLARADMKSRARESAARVAAPAAGVAVGTALLIGLVLLGRAAWARWRR